MEKRTSRKKGLRVKSSVGNMFIKHICLFSSLDLGTRRELWQGVFLFQFNKKDTNLPVKKNLTNIGLSKRHKFGVV